MGPKYIKLFLLLILNLIILTTYSKVKLAGKVYYEEFGKTISLSEAKVNVLGTMVGVFTDVYGNFIVEDEYLPSQGEIVVTKFNFTPKMIEYNLRNNDTYVITLLPSYVYYITPPLSGSTPKSDSVYIIGSVVAKDSQNKQSGVIVRLIDTPYSYITNESGIFKIGLTLNEISLSPKKIFSIFLEKPGFEIKIVTFEKKAILESFKTHSNYFNCETISLEKYMTPSEVEISIESKISAFLSQNTIPIKSSFDSSYYNKFFLTLEHLENLINKMSSDTNEIPSLKNSLAQIYNEQKNTFASISAQNQLDSLFIIEFQNVNNSFVSHSNMINNLDETDSIIINSLNSLGLDISSTRNDLNKRIEENIIKFNENAQILNESYLKRSRQYDTTAFQIFITFPVTLGPRYSDFVFASTLGQIGFNTNYGLRFLQKAKIYNSYSYNFLSFANADTNYHTLEDGTVLWANTKNISANYFSWAINFRPPIDFISNLKIDPGVGFSVGYDYKNIEYNKTNDTLPHISVQAFIQVTAQYKIFTPEPGFNIYDPKFFASNPEDMKELISSDDLIKKYNNSFEYYNYKKAKSIKTRHTFQNLGHNTYLYFSITDRLVFNNKKYLYGLANFAFGLKFDISSFVNNQKIAKRSCESTEFCHPVRPN
jgi:hypothetical protein